MLGVYGAASHVKCFRDKHTVRVFPLNKYTGTGSAGIVFGVCRDKHTCLGSTGKLIGSTSPEKNGIQEKIEHADTNPVNFRYYFPGQQRQKLLEAHPFGVCRDRCVHLFGIDRDAQQEHNIFLLSHMCLI